jgi:hypothetical protein
MEYIACRRVGMCKLLPQIQKIVEIRLHLQRHICSCLRYRSKEVKAHSFDL